VKVWDGFYLVLCMEVAGAKVWFETCVDDYGAIWVDGKCDLALFSIDIFRK